MVFLLHCSLLIRIKKNLDNENPLLSSSIILTNILATTLNSHEETKSSSHWLWWHSHEECCNDMVLSGIEDETTKVGVIDFINTSCGISIVDINSVGTVVTIDLVNIVNSIEWESCECQ